LPAANLRRRPGRFRRIPVATTRSDGACDH
jgi:hypothetical protein